MTDLLKDTFTTQAAGSEPPPLDLDAIVAAGNHRLRRRRAGVVLGTALAVVAVVAIGLTVIRPHAAEPAAQPHAFTERRPTYAVGGTIHYGATTIETGTKKVDRLVLSDAGILFTVQGSQKLRLADGRRIRTLGSDLDPASRVVASGELAGWEERTSDGYRTLVKNLRTGATVFTLDHVGELSVPTADRPAVGRLVGLDGEYAFLDLQPDLYQVDLQRGSEHSVSTPYARRQIITFGEGRLIWLAGNDPTVHSSYIGFSDTTGTGGSVQAFSGTVAEITAAVAPKGRYVAVQAGATPLRIHTSTGGRHEFTGSLRPTRFGHWLSDRTFLASRSTDLITCSLANRGPISCRLTQRDAAPPGAELVFPSN